jgi:hypothetical protein
MSNHQISFCTPSNSPLPSTSSGFLFFFIEFSILRVGTAQCSGIPIKTNANYLGRLDAYTASVAALQPTYSDDRP